MSGLFGAAIGPFFVAEQDGTARLGLRVERHHCNARGVCHGGMLATFADIMMPVVMCSDPALNPARRLIPTASLQLDFLAPAYVGDWLEADAQVLKATRSLVFAQGLVRSRGRPVLRCSAVYKIVAERGA